MPNYFEQINNEKEKIKWKFNTIKKDFLVNDLIKKKCPTLVLKTFVPLMEIFVSVLLLKCCCSLYLMITRKFSFQNNILLRIFFPENLLRDKHIS